MKKGTDNLLLKWLKGEGDAVATRGFEVSINEAGGSTTGSAVNIDGSGVVGTISHWPPSTFEFHFIECDTGDNLCLETKDFVDERQLAAFIGGLLDRWAAMGSS